MRFAASRGYPSHLISWTMVVAALLLFVGADAIVRFGTPLAQQFDIQGELNKPDLLLRPVYTTSIILLVYAALRSTLLQLTGRSLESSMLADDATAAPVVNLLVSFAFVFVAFGLYAYATTDGEFFAEYFSEDGWIENLTPLLYLASFALCCLSLVRVISKEGHALPIVGIILVLGAAVLFLGLEEISYGQRIFGWDTPAALATQNLQGETNLHNMLDYDDLNLVKWFGITAVFIVMCLGVLLQHVSRRRWSVFLPHESLLPLAGLLAVLASHGALQEVLENSMALFALLYSVQIMQAAGQPETMVAPATSSRRMLENNYE